MKRVVDPSTGEIDWSQLRARVGKAFEASLPSPHQAQEILAERARRLARAADAELRPVESLEILPFRLGREQYALETQFAREVIRLTEFTALPGVPEFVIGVANLRGDIIPIFDLMRFFGFASQGLMDRSRVIVVGRAGADFGVIADSVQEVSRLPVENFAPNSVFEGQRGRECVQGVTRDAMIVLDGAALLSDQRLFIGASNNAA
jgi:purine-binding chemotaxis protein CheW